MLKRDKRNISSLLARELKNANTDRGAIFKGMKVSNYSILEFSSIEE